MDGTQSEPERDLLVRLRRLEGQIRGVQRMVAEGRPCDDIVTQLLAVRAAVDQVGLLLLSQQVERCLQGAPEGRGVEELRRALRHFTRLGGDPSQD
ncbi:MAG: metal-sensitive transcriptional regulator [Anaerolineae bacterium]